MDNLFKKEKESILQTYTRLGIAIDRAEGCYIYDTKGNKYLDLLGGIAVNVLGHSHPEVVKAAKDQIDRYMHVSNFFYQEPQIKLAEKLKELTGLSKVFFGNSGTETTDGSLKIARKWGAERQKHRIISFKGAFHGRGYGALSMMDKPFYKDNMGPFMAGFDTIPYNNPSVLADYLNDNTACVFFEVIQGEGGLVGISHEWVDELNRLQKKHDFLIAIDEVQSGIWRTGKFSAYDHFDLSPDILWYAKGLGGGLPLGAIVISERLDGTLASGQHGTTFGGNAVSCAAGLAQLEQFDDDMIEIVNDNSGYLRAGLESIKSKYPKYVDGVRGLGYMVGLNLTFEAKKLRDILLQDKIIANSTSNNILRLVPPLILTKEQITTFIESLDNAFEVYSEMLP
jgi:predicted acetylornithine/succinylornithine family transaminase